MAPFYSL